MDTTRIFTDRSTSWSTIGKDVSECRDIEQVITDSGLGYFVIKKPYYKRKDGRYVRDPNRFYTMRKDGSKEYDTVVSKDYSIIQNRDAFDFVSYIGDLKFLKAGETERGMVYIIAALPEVNILGDAFTPHLIFSNGFGGNFSVRAAICPLRIICQNQFAIAFKEAENSICIRHSKNAKDRLESAKLIMRDEAAYMQQLNKMAEGYAKMQVSPRQIDMVMEAMFPVKDNMTEASVTRLMNKRERFKEQFYEAYRRNDNYYFTGTAWGLVNAYTYIVTHEPTTKNAENHFMNATFGNDVTKFVRIVTKVAA